MVSADTLRWHLNPFGLEKGNLSIWGDRDVMTWKHFPRYWPFVMRIHHLWTKASNTGSEVLFNVSLNGTIEQTVELSVIWDAMTFMWHHTNEIYSGLYNLVSLYRHITLSMILMEVSQPAYDMIHYISGLFGYFYVCEIYVNLIWYLYLFMLNKFCLSLSLSHVIITMSDVT